MSRTTITVPFKCSFEEAQKKVESVLIRHNFHSMVIKTGENVWKNGTGLLTAMKYVKVEYGQDSFDLSAWIQVGIGSVGGGEMDLNGIVGALPKRQLMKILEEIKSQF